MSERERSAVAENRAALLSGTSLSTKFRDSMATMKRIINIATPFWTDKRNWRDWLLLGGMVGLSFGQVALNVQFNDFNQNFTNALTSYNQPETWNQLKLFCQLASVWIASAVYKQYLTQKLQMNWRRAMTNDAIDTWLSDKAYYHMEHGDRKTDNPDQRITDDINRFTGSVLGLGIGLLKTTTSLISFSAILWNKSGAMDLTIAGHQLTVPGYMFWVALAYAGVGTYVTHKIGNKLAGLNNQQQRYEADFRYSTVRLRENAEAIAFSDNEQAESGVLKDRFNKVVINYWNIIKKQKELTWFSSGYAQVANIFPLLPLLPRYFSKSMDYGQMMSTAGAFGNVQGDLSWYIDSYTELAELKAVTARLNGFYESVENIKNKAAAPALEI